MSRSASLPHMSTSGKGAPGEEDHNGAPAEERDAQPELYVHFLLNVSL